MDRRLMKHATALVGLAGLILGGGMVIFWSAAAADMDSKSMTDGADLVAGNALYADYCASCHGANLEGQENWRSRGDDGRLPAPPHDETGHTWHHGDQLLFRYTKLGGAAMMAAQGVDFDSGMPGFEDQLTDQEIWNILGFIKSTWPERIQEVQAVRSEAELLKEGK